MLFVESLTIGGLPNYVLQLANALMEVGETVVLAYTGDPVPVHLELGAVSLVHLPNNDTDRLKAMVAGWSPDVIHVHLCSDLGILEVLGAQNAPLIRSFHDYTSLCLRRGRRRFPGDRCQRALGTGCVLFGCAIGASSKPGGKLPGWKSISNKLLERSRYQGFDAAIVGSGYMRGTLIKNSFERSRIHLVPYFSKFDQDAGAEPYVSTRNIGVPGLDRPIEFLFTGQAVAGKGLKVLITALGNLAGDWRLTVVSDGPDLAAAKAMSVKFGVDDRIKFIGWLAQSSLAALYAKADLLVIPSIWDDPGPLVGLEALSMGTPVLGFPVGGIPDYVIDGVTGFLTDDVNADALTQGLGRAISDGEQLHELGQKGRALIVANHGRRSHAKAIMQIYSDASMNLNHQRTENRFSHIPIREAI